VAAVPVDAPEVAQTAASSNVRSFEPGPRIDPNTAVSTRARVIISIAEYWGKVIGWIRRIFDAAGVNARRWWVWTDRPPSLRTIWRLSAYDPQRVPAGNTTFGAVWVVANGTERLLMFALVVFAPGFVQPLLRWCFQRPARRLGLWLATVLLVAGLLLARWSGR
jgi:hypothetical protein